MKIKVNLLKREDKYLTKNTMFNLNIPYIEIFLKKMVLQRERYFYKTFYRQKKQIRIKCCMFHCYLVNL
jgi:hypothetical protein